MKILFVMRNVHYLRNYESVVTELCRRRHRVMVGLELDIETVPVEIRRFASRLLERNQDYMTIVTLAKRRFFWAGTARQLRALRDYCRYLLPLHQDAQRCGDRAKSALIWPLRFMTFLSPPLRAPIARLVGGLTAYAEQILPPSRGAIEAIRLNDPDAVLITPLIDIDSDQIDYVKACRALRIPVGHCVASWDNLTNKGLIKVLPDRVFVWNEAQEREAVELHSVPEQRVRVTGAQIFDWWFDYAPSRSREEFCRELGLDPAQLILLYTASSVFICRNEIDFVLRWLGALRGSTNLRLRDASVIIRPHPKAANTLGQWDDPRLKGLGSVVVFPRRGHMPVSRATRNDYFDSLYHCAAVVGINTSAMLEAAIVGRRCFTIQLDDVKEGQEGMVHFQHLKKENFLGVACSLEEHFDQVSLEIDGGPASTREFVRTFLRPYGLEQAGTPIFVAHVEEMEDLAVEGRSVPARLGWLLRPLLLPVTLFVVFAEFEERSRRVARKRARRVARGVRHALSKLQRHVARAMRRSLRLGRQARFILGRSLRSWGVLRPLPESRAASDWTEAPPVDPEPVKRTARSEAKQRYVA